MPAHGRPAHPVPEWEGLISRFPTFQLPQKIQKRAPEKLFVPAAHANQAHRFELVSHDIQSGLADVPSKVRSSR